MTVRVRFVSEESIERDANTLLAEFARARHTEIKAPIPIEDIVEKHLKLQVEFDDLHSLFGLQRGAEPDIFGAIWLETREIVIDESLDPEEDPSMEGRYRFTLAHEGGGHWSVTGFFSVLFEWSRHERAMSANDSRTAHPESGRVNPPDFLTETVMSEGSGGHD
jgi:hypothetical protein